MSTTRSQHGFQILVVLVLVVVVGVVGFVGYTVTRSQTSQKQPGSNQVIWAYNEQAHEYFVRSGQAPACDEPFIFAQTPVDISQVTSIMMPGAYRGYNYKPHGGFRFDNSQDGQIEVKLPADATLVGLTRYYEGEPSTLQYVVSFETDCGIAFRFDHLHTLSPKLQAIAETTPAPKKDDTSSSPADAPARTPFTAGEIIATAVGFPATKNFGVDFGVYDYRQRNTMASNSYWTELHEEHSSLDWFGVCWFDMLPGSAAATAKTLSLKQVNSQKTLPVVSDYCSNAQYKTLEFNNGKPTEN